MATMIEKRLNSVRKEIEKYEDSMAKNQERIEKCKVKLAKLGLTSNDIDEIISGRCNVWSSYQDKTLDVAYSMQMACDRIEELKSHIANANSRLEKLEKKFDTVEAKLDEEKELEEKEKKYSKFMFRRSTEEELEKSKREWEELVEEAKKDGIMIESSKGCIICGKLNNGTDFILYINSGYTERSLYCYTLKIGGETIFTSGTFGICYTTLKRRAKATR